MGLKIIFVVQLLFNFSLYAQDHIWVKQTKVSEAIIFERDINPLVKFLSQNVSLSKGYYPLSDKYKVTIPVIVQREAFNYLPVYAEYFYTPADSILRLVSYDWEKDRYGNIFEKQKIWKEESKKFGIYNTEYERIKASLLSELGTPAAADTIAKEINDNGNRYFTRETLWESNTIHAELNMIFASMTYRIRLTLYWKQ